MTSEFCRDSQCSRKSKCKRYKTNEKQFDPLKKEWAGECNFFFPVGAELMTLQEYAEQRAGEEAERRMEML